MFGVDKKVTRRCLWSLMDIAKVVDFSAKCNSSLLDSVEVQISATLLVVGQTC